LRAFAEMLPAVEVDKQAMRAAAAEGFSTATDLADYLVRKGVPFRAAHELVGQVVRMALERKALLNELPLEALRALSPAIEQDVYNVLSLEGSLKSRNLLGGAAPAQARLQIQAARARLGSP
jgi:argininosuccinate lyase